MDNSIIDQGFGVSGKTLLGSPKLARFLKVAYIVLIALTVIDLMMQLWTYFLIEKGIYKLHESDYARLETAGIFQLVVNLFALIVSTGCLVIFMIWVNRCYRNVFTLDGKATLGRMLFGFSWFIPLLAFVLPIIGVRDIWNCYQKESIQNMRLWSGLEFIYLWWGLFVLYRISWWLLSVLPFIFGLISHQNLYSESIMSNGMILSMIINGLVFIPILALQVYLVKTVDAWEVQIIKSLNQELV
ncbi:MAG: DUF4328 domain-containing protein [Flavobacteriales bacterium]|nr:DUF4328 domain-containing protein [Flavobacteriales bacterium]